MDAAEIIRSLQLAPHPEGGWYREIYRSQRSIVADGAARSALTSIYYLLEQGQVSRWHIVDADEAWHFYCGAALALFTYDPQVRRLERHLLATPGQIAQTGQRTARERPAPGPGEGGAGDMHIAPVHVVRAGVWQGARSLGAYSLVGCSVAPGFEFAGFRFVASLPGHQAHIAAAPEGLRGQLLELL